MVPRRGSRRGRVSPASPGLKERPNLLAGEDLPREPHQKRSIEKRARLKEAALALFGQKGFEGTSVDDIARRANLAVGGFYQHFRSKRQLLLVLMDELLAQLSRLEFRPQVTGDAWVTVRALLAHAFEQDLRYLGAYRAWQEVVLSDAGLAKKNAEIHAWTTMRVTAVLQLLHKLPHARKGVDVAALGQVMDGFFWSLMVRALAMSKVELDRWIDTSTHLMVHAIFADH